MANTAVIDEISTPSHPQTNGATPELRKRPGPKRAPRVPRGLPPSAGASEEPYDEQHRQAIADEEAAQHEPTEADELASTQDFWVKLANYTATDWEHLLAYLYRTAPTIDRRGNGRAINLRRYSKPFDKETIKLDEGSGGYRVDLLRRNQVSGKYRRIGQDYFEILDMDHPPRVPLGDWIDDPENQVWQWAKNKLQVAAQQAAHPGMDPTQIMKETWSMAEKFMGNNNNGDASMQAEFIKQIGAMQKTMMEANSPERLVALVKLIAPGAPATDPVLTEILKEMRADQKAMREELQAIKTAPARKSIIEEIIELEPVIDRFRKVLNPLGAAAAAAGPPDFWANVADKAVDQIAPLIPVLIAKWGGPKVEEEDDASKPWPGVAPPHARKENTAPPPAAAAAPGAPGTTAGAAPNATADEQKMRDQFRAIMEKWRPHLNLITAMLVDFYKRGLTGYHFRDWHIEGYGRIAWNDLKQDLGAEALTNLLMANEQISKQLGGDIERVRPFVNSWFIEPGKEEPGTFVDEGQDQGQGQDGENGKA